ncbi:hypothetical protein [Nannocystis pusilla]|uniref:hypothetical protein n=1 Tax=Nannocystis pusilla TaxID=889268 RepID=UPI003B7897DF
MRIAALSDFHIGARAGMDEFRHDEAAFLESSPASSPATIASSSSATSGRPTTTCSPARAPRRVSSTARAAGCRD